jgi:hypothetical protein
VGGAVSKPRESRKNLGQSVPVCPSLRFLKIAINHTSDKIITQSSSVSCPPVEKKNSI